MIYNKNNKKKNDISIDILKNSKYLISFQKYEYIINKIYAELMYNLEIELYKKYLKLVKKWDNIIDKKYSYFKKFKNLQILILKQFKKYKIKPQYEKLMISLIFRIDSKYKNLLFSYIFKNKINNKYIFKYKKIIKDIKKIIEQEKKYIIKNLIQLINEEYMLLIKNLIINNKKN